MVNNLPTIPEDIQGLLEMYLIYLMNNLKIFPNQLIILDSSIDRKYKQVKDWADKNNFSMFLIALEISQKEAASRIQTRNTEGAQAYLDNLNKWISDNNTFRSNNPVNFVIKNRSFDKSKLISTVSDRLN